MNRDPDLCDSRAAALTRRSAVLDLKVHCDSLSGLRKFGDVFEIGISLLCIAPKISQQLNPCCAGKFCLGIALTPGFLRFLIILRMYGEKSQRVQKQKIQSVVIAAGNLRSDVRCSCRGDQMHDCARFLVPKKIRKKFKSASDSSCVSGVQLCRLGFESAL